MPMPTRSSTTLIAASVANRISFRSTGFRYRDTANALAAAAVVSGTDAAGVVCIYGAAILGSGAGNPPIGTDGAGGAIPAALAFSASSASRVVMNEGRSLRKNEGKCAVMACRENAHQFYAALRLAWALDGCKPTACLAGSGWRDSVEALCDVSACHVGRNSGTRRMGTTDHAGHARALAEEHAASESVLPSLWERNTSNCVCERC